MATEHQIAASLRAIQAHVAAAIDVSQPPSFLVEKTSQPTDTTVTKIGNQSILIITYGASDPDPVVVPPSDSVEGTDLKSAPEKPVVTTNKKTNRSTGSISVELAVILPGGEEHVISQETVQPNSRCVLPVDRQNLNLRIKPTGSIEYSVYLF